MHVRKSVVDPGVGIASLISLLYVDIHIIRGVGDGEGGW